MKYKLSEHPLPSIEPFLHVIRRVLIWAIVVVFWIEASPVLWGQEFFGAPTKRPLDEPSRDLDRRLLAPIFPPRDSHDTRSQTTQNRPFGMGSTSLTQPTTSRFQPSPSSVRRASFSDDDLENSPAENDEDWQAWGPMSMPSDHGLPDRWITGVDGCRVNPNREPRWRDARPVPWESMAYGEYIGPPRTPHLPEYRVLIGDQIDFVFRRKRNLSSDAYRFGIGDVLAISSEQYEALNDADQTIQLDGTIQVRGIGSVIAANKTVLQLQNEINDKAQTTAGLKSPDVMIKPVNTETKLQDLIKTVDATAGLGGLSRSVNVIEDGTVQLPGIRNVPALGLSLDELSAEANARYSNEVEGLEVTAILTARAPRFVYVMGEVRQPGQIALSGPTTVMQAIAQANGTLSGANLRHIIVMRRDKNWQLIATKVDLSGALWGHRPIPSDDLWLRHSDIVLVPKNAGQRIADFVEVYFNRGLYGIFPTQGFSVTFDGVSRL